MLNNKEVKLICKSIKYHSMIDEEMFFTWLDKIPSIRQCNGMGCEFYIYFKNSRIPDEDLREIIGLFYRYKVDMKQLKVFLNDKNKKWFFDQPKAYWHRRVFGAISPK